MSNYVRRRGVTLTPQGLRKLNKAKIQTEVEQNFERYTLETLSEETGLTPTTLSKVFTGSAGVDKRTLICCFNAFNLILKKDDYTYLKPNQSNPAKLNLIPLVKNFNHLEATCNLPLENWRNRPITSQTTKMAQTQNNLQSVIPSLPAGQLPLDSEFYIDRPILESVCYQAIGQPGALLNIRAPKQMGKTSLMSRILAYAKVQGCHIVSVSLQLADSEILQNLERFLKWFCARVSRQLGLSDQTANFWDNSLNNKSTATDYFNDVILTNCDRPLIIAIDELNQLFAYLDIAREFLLLLRTWSEKAKLIVRDSNIWHKLRLVIVYSTEVLLPSAINPSLLNTTLVINLPESTSTQVQDLALRYEEKLTEQQIKQLIILLGGHPYRLQLAFYYLQQQTITLEELLENSVIQTALYEEHLQQQWWNLQRYPELLPSFTQIVSNPKPLEIAFYPSSQLSKMGLVHLESGRTSLCCELFRPFFRRILN